MTGDRISERWYVRWNGSDPWFRIRPLPVSRAGIRLLLRTHAIRAGSRVRQEGTSHWRRVSELPWAAPLVEARRRFDNGQRIRIAIAFMVLLASQAPLSLLRLHPALSLGVDVGLMLGLLGVITCLDDRARRWPFATMSRLASSLDGDWANPDRPFRRDRADGPAAPADPGSSP